MPYKKLAHEIDASMHHAFLIYLLSGQEIARWVLIVFTDINQASPLELADADPPDISALR